MNQEQRDTIERLKQHAQRRIWVTFQKEGGILAMMKILQNYINIVNNK